MPFFSSSSAWSCNAGSIFGGAAALTAVAKARAARPASNGYEGTCNFLREPVTRADRSGGAAAVNVAIQQIKDLLRPGPASVADGQLAGLCHCLPCSHIVRQLIL